MFGRLAMGFAYVRAGTRVLMLVLVQAMVYEALEVLSTALTQISRDAGAAYNDARAAAADVVEKPGAR